VGEPEGEDEEEQHDVQDEGRDRSGAQGENDVIKTNVLQEWETLVEQAKERLFKKYFDNVERRVRLLIK
jgi:hypothetical protein